jgi:tetratricopeptide (TPR) repeat protein
MRRVAEPAHSCFSTVISESPNNKGNLDQALLDLNKAIELDPGNSNAYANRGLVYQAKGLKTQAIADFETHLRLEPNASDRAAVEKAIQTLKGQ